MSELTREQKQKILNDAPEGAELYRMDSELYYKFNGDACWRFDQGNGWIESWMTKVDIGFIKLSDLREELSQTKLTSSDIKWKDGKQFVVIDKLNSRAIEQYEDCNGLEYGEHGCFYKFDAYGCSYNADFFYVVDREPATFETGDTCYHPEIKCQCVYLCKDPNFDTGSYILPDESSVPVAVTTMLLTTEPPAPTTEQVLEDTAKALYGLAIAPDKQPCWNDSIGYIKTIFRTLAASGVKLPKSK